jgi:hypothetical protein
MFNQRRELKSGSIYDNKTGAELAPVLLLFSRSMLKIVDSISSDCKYSSL